MAGSTKENPNLWKIVLLSNDKDRVPVIWSDSLLVKNWFSSLGDAISKFFRRVYIIYYILFYFYSNICELRNILERYHTSQCSDVFFWVCATSRAIRFLLKKEDMMGAAGLWRAMSSRPSSVQSTHLSLVRLFVSYPLFCGRYTRVQRKTWTLPCFTHYHTYHRQTSTAAAASRNHPDSNILSQILKTQRRKIHCDARTNFPTPTYSTSAKSQPNAKCPKGSVTTTTESSIVQLS